MYENTAGDSVTCVLYYRPVFGEDLLLFIQSHVRDTRVIWNLCAM